MVLATVLVASASACVVHPEVETKTLCPVMARPTEDVPIVFISKAGNHEIQSYDWDKTNVTASSGLWVRDGGSEFLVALSRSLRHYGGEGFGQKEVTVSWSTVAEFPVELGDGYGYTHRVPVFGSCTFTVVEHGHPMVMSGLYEVQFDLQVSRPCEDEDYSAIVRVAQTGTDLTVTGLNGDEPAWTGVADLGTAVISGTKRQDDGLVETELEVHLEVQSRRYSLSGTEDWTWKKGSDTCTGTHTVTMFRLGD